MTKIGRFLILLLVVSLLPICASADTLTVQNTSSSLALHITDAYYTAYESDGIEDDVVVLFTIDLDSQGRTQFDIHLTLTLPSSFEVTYSYFINTVLNHLDATMIFYDYATELGWYNINIAVQLYSGGLSSASLNHIFDPPGGTEGGDPDGQLILS